MSTVADTRKRNAKRLNDCLRRIVEKRREVESKGEKDRYTHVITKFQGIARRGKKAFLHGQCKEIEETVEWERLEISSRKLEIQREHFMQIWAQ